MEYMFMPLRRYADFSGRSRRKEYWMFILFVVIVEVILYAAMFAGADLSTGQLSAGAMVPLLILMVFALGIFIPSLAVIVRRLHDQDKSGWMFLLVFIPLVGPIILIVFMCIEGTRGPNRYGPDPKEGEGAQSYA
jgi:uncharacterized membrane protein YhaH (DUF805 family)